MSQSAPNKPALQIDADDNLDDLDDVLSEFSPRGAPPLSPMTSPPPPPPTATTTTTFGRRPRTNTRVDSAPISIPGSGTLPAATEDSENESALSDEFTKELVKNMQDLMRDLAAKGNIPESVNEEDETGTGSSEEEIQQKETERLMKAAWEAMLIEGMDGSDGPPLSSSDKPVANDFQSKIKQTMEKLKESEDNLQSSSPPGSAGPESIQGLLNSLKDLGLDDFGGDGPEDEAELAGFLENMMGNLMTKEVLYEPLKELSEKFPAYLQNPPSDLSPADKTRFEKQNEYVAQIVKIFEDPKYDENDKVIGGKVAELMGEMQNYGAPPESIMGEIPPELGADGNCVIT